MEIARRGWMAAVVAFVVGLFSPRKAAAAPPATGEEFIWTKDGDHWYLIWRYETLTEIGFIGALHSYRRSSGQSPEVLLTGARGIEDYINVLRPEKRFMSTKAQATGYGEPIEELTFHYPSGSPAVKLCFDLPPKTWIIS